MNVTRPSKGLHARISEGDASRISSDRQDASRSKINLQRSLQLLDDAVGASPSARLSFTSSRIQESPSTSFLPRYPPTRLERGDAARVGRDGLEASVFPSPVSRRSISSSYLPSGLQSTPSAASAARRPMLLDETATTYMGLPNTTPTAQQSGQLLAELTLRLDESQMTSTNVALLLEEDGDVASSSGVYADFELAVRTHAADNLAFDLVISFISILEEQTSLLGRLLERVTAGQQRFKHVFDTYTLLCCELWTWRLVDTLYRDIIETEAKEAAGTTAPAFSDDDTMNVDNGSMMGITSRRSDAQLVEELYERSADTRRRQIVVDWLETQAERTLAALYDKVHFYRDGSTAAWENTLHQLKKSDRLAPGKSSESTYVTQLDPDAPHREKRQLADLDKEDDVRLFKHVFIHIRAGKLEEAEALCIRCGQAWRAASLEGWRLYHDPNFVSTSNVVTDVQGNAHRDVWKSVCWNMSQQEHFHVCERAIYAALSGNLRCLLPVCETWEDSLWAHLRTSIDVQVEQHVRLSTADALAADRSLASLPEEYWNRNLSLDKIFQAIESSADDKIRDEARTWYHVIQKSVILDDVRGLIANLGGWASALTKPGETKMTMTTPPAQVLRFMAHVVLFLKKIGRLAAEQADTVDAVLAAYVHQLTAEKKHGLVATYVALLPRNQQVATYAAFLEDVTESDARLQCLKLAEEANLDASSITKAVVEGIFAKYAANFTVASAGSALDRSTSKADSICIDALEWLTFEPAQRLELVRQANRIIRIFIAMGKLAAARDAFQRVPTDSVDHITRLRTRELVLDATQADSTINASPDLPASSANTIKEYLCLRAYLDAQDSFNDWFQHFHHRRPEVPTQQLQVAAGSSFSERVAHEQKLKQHGNELQRWKASMRVQTTATVERLYNVLLFPEGGWMKDKFADTSSSSEISMEEDEEFLASGGTKTSQDGDGSGRREQMRLLRRLCLPAVVTLLLSVLHDSEQYRQCLQLADIVASEQYRLYKAFSKDDLRRLLERLRDSSLALLHKNADPLGYGTGSSLGTAA